MPISEEDYRPKKSIDYTMVWGVVEDKVEQMDQTNFILPYFRKPKNKRQVNGTEVSKDKHENSTKHEDTCQCYYCNSKSHLLMACGMYKLRKSKRKNRSPDVNKRAKYLIES